MGMTWKSLKDEIRDLGYEEDETMQEYQTIVINACNRAIQFINSTVRPIVDKYVISRYPIENVLPNPLYLFDIVPYRGDTIEYEADAKAYYFECDGTGTATITDNTGTTTLTLNSDGIFKPYRGFISNHGKIVFSGEFSYNIRNLAMYSILKSNNVEDIPAYNRECRYDISELTKESGKIVFMDFADDKPVMEGSFTDSNTYKIVEDYKIEERKIIVLNYFDKGQFTIWFKRRPTTITLDTLDEFEIELDYDVQPLVSLLASHYIWLDDEERKATLYYNQYDDLKNQILGKATTQPVEASFTNTTGWW